MHTILKFVFLEIQNKAIRPVLSGPVTYYITCTSEHAYSLSSSMSCLIDKPLQFFSCQALQHAQVIILPVEGIVLTGGGGVRSRSLTHQFSHIVLLIL